MEKRSPVTFVQTHSDSRLNLLKVCSGSLSRKSVLLFFCYKTELVSGLKRKASEYEEMQYTSSVSPFVLNCKKPRMTCYGRPLPIVRLLEHLDSTSLRDIIQTLVNRHPTLLLEVTSISSRPDLSSVISILNGMEEQVRRSFPYGCNSAGEYAYNRIRPMLQKLMDTLLEYTCIFLPPYESNKSLTLTFLDHVTSMAHRFPEWNNPEHNYAKEELYHEISNAWISVILNIGKEGWGGINGHEWMEKLIKHNEVGGGRLKSVIDVARCELAYFFSEKIGDNIPFLPSNKLGFDFASCYQI
ncbi:hypothetical protein PMAC_003077 [Pneumocystis sp. 'macacae']|nr:hypothetical protein PMAC_003077 [Pneumocystis sp. 'macacae']